MNDVIANRIQNNKKASSEKKTDEMVVRKILSDFAKSKKKKVISTQAKSGRRAEVLTKGKRGRYVRYRMPEGKVTDIAIAPTIRAAAMHAQDGRIRVLQSDYREKVRRRRICTLINIVLDTSGSMDEIDKVDITRSVIVALLKDAYQRRDKVSLVTYSGRKAKLVLPFTSSVERAKRYLETIPFGGTTPMASGILTGLHVLHNEIKKDPSTIPIMILVTDGKANMPLEVGGNIRRELALILKYVISEGIHLLAVDMSSQGSELATEITRMTGGRYFHPERLSKESLYKAISDERDDDSYFTNV
jgi:magnesium chelatase subunit D